MATTISTIYRASVDVPNHVYAEFGDTQEFEQKSAQISSAANVASSGQDAYSDVYEWAEDSSRACVENWAAMWEMYLTELGKRATPTTATHYSCTYDVRQFYRRTPYKHLNQVSEEWQDRVRWEYWTGDGWEDVGEGFSDRRLKEIGT